MSLASRLQVFMVDPFESCKPELLFVHVEVIHKYRLVIDMMLSNCLIRLQIVSHRLDRVGNEEATSLRDSVGREGLPSC